jgi:hypothetical protein
MAEHPSSSAAGHPSKSTFAVAFIGAFAFLYLRTFLLPATPFAGLDDQALFFARAARILNGQILYRDFFELVTPGTDLLYAAAFRVFGIHAWVMQAWIIAAGLALATVVTVIASRILRGPLVLLPGLLFLVFDFNSGLDLTHHWFSALFILCSIGVLTGGIENWRLASASFFCGIATLFTQSEGVLAFAALAIYWLWLKRFEAKEGDIGHQVAALLSPFLLVVSAVMGYYIYRAGLHAIFFDLVIFPVRYLSLSVANQPRTYLGQIPPVHKAADIVRLIPTVFIYALVPYVYLFGFYRLWRERKSLSAATRQRLVLLHVFGAALFLAVANGPRYFRLCTVAAPAILIFVWLISRNSSATRFTRSLLCYLAIGCAILFALHRQTQWHAVLDLPIGRTAFSEESEFYKYQWMAQRTRPSELFYGDSALCLYLQLQNPSASDFVTYEEYTRPEEIAALVQSIKATPPHFIVFVGRGANYSPVHDHTAPFLQYVHGAYRLVQTFTLGQSSYQQEVWERR